MMLKNKENNVIDIIIVLPRAGTETWLLTEKNPQSFIRVVETLYIFISVVYIWVYIYEQKQLF